ncbi:MAG: hypothetical protein AseanaTS_18910 [Candidatus Pelagadaptatus aseana]|uniref:hypothetical protein n=1 Tax=Candidatus Pelagadaptatus aseana TaxID=3120508 RepID=UPI0039B1B091
MLKCLSIQMQPDLDDSHSEQEVIDRVKTLGRFPEVDLIEEDQRFVNLNFFTEELPVLWRELQQGLLQDDELGAWVKKVSIIVCEGDKSWDDYLLLSHPDASEKLDSL